MVTALPSLVMAARLNVGPGQTYAKPSQAIAAAKDGDTIQIDPAGDYTNDVACINRNNISIQGTGDQMVKIKTNGQVYGDKGIWLFAEGANNLTIRNIQFEGARISEEKGANAAGLRAQGRNLTVDHCRFTNNQDGILGGVGKTTIEHCEFDHNGPTNLTHNLYIGDQAGTLVFRYNYSHDSITGHLLKSRSAVNIIEYNRLSDEQGTGSYELDLPNGGVAKVIGNIIEQSANSQNGTLLAYGEEGLVNKDSELCVINNTFVNHRSAGTFVNAQKLPGNFSLIARNNIFAGPGTAITMDRGTPKTGGNVQHTIEAMKFADAKKYDFSLQQQSPAVGIGIDPGTAGDGSHLMPVEEYLHPLSRQAIRPSETRDAGAYQYLAR